MRPISRFFLVLLAQLISSSLLFAQSRTVSIASVGQVKLTNPTTTTVTYSISCKNKDGTVILSESNSTMLSGKSRTFGTATGSQACNTTISQMVSSSSGLTGGAASCYTMSGAPHTTVAATYCGAGFHLCTMPDVNAVKTGNTWGMIQAPTSGTWSYRYYDMPTPGYIWGNTSSNSSGKIAFIDSMNMTDYRCATEANGAGTVVPSSCVTYDWIDPMTSNVRNVSAALCCPDLLGLEYCSVTIENSTGPSGHLISPQFKGGSPF